MDKTLKPATIADLNQLARDAVKQGNFQQAKVACRKALKLAPNSAMSYKLMGDIAQAKGKLNAAKKCYLRSLELQPKLAGSYVQLGKVYSTAKLWKRALSYYQQAIKLQPNLSKTWLQVQLAEIWEQLGNVESAIACYEKILEIQPHHWHLYHKLGKCWYAIGNSSAAVTAYQHAIALNPDIPSLYLHLGEALRTLEQWHEAGSAYLQTIERESSWQANLSIAYDRLGNTLQQEVRQCGYKPTIQNYAREYNSIKQSGLYERLSDRLEEREYYEGALVFGKLAIARQPENLELPKKLDRILYKQERVEQQVVSYLAQMARTPNFNWCQCYDVWKTLEKHGLLEAAVTVFARLLQKNPNGSVVLLNLGEALTRQGKISEAIACYQIFHQQMTPPKMTHQITERSTIQPPVTPPTGNPPNFLIVGAQKSGTTSLYYYLISHPQILPAIRKEVDFFSWKYANGVDWYLAHFPAVDRDRYVTGEASPSYLNHPDAATRLKAVNPEVKLIVLLRNPIDRAVSHYSHWRRLGWETRSFAEAIAWEKAQLETTPNYWHSQQNYLAGGIYVEFLQQWLKVFPKKQFLILSSEAFYTQPDATVSQVWKFLELPEHQLCDYKIYNGGTHLGIDSSMRQTLSTFFQPHNRQLEEFLGMTFHWE